PPDSLTNVENLRHRDRKIFSLINVPLWQKANWMGTAYLFVIGSPYPPVLGLIFEDSEAARAISKGWNAKIGDIDHHEELRVSIITDIDRSHPSHYRLLVGSNPRLSPE